MCIVTEYGQKYRNTFQKPYNHDWYSIFALYMCSSLHTVLILIEFVSTLNQLRYHFCSSRLIFYHNLSGLCQSTHISVPYGVCQKQLFQASCSHNIGHCALWYIKNFCYINYRSSHHKHHNNLTTFLLDPTWFTYNSRELSWRKMVLMWRWTYVVVM